ncbi:MAG TPA: GNAT family N-acetyltransferase [Stellaceae bacterium]|nr:GNAT family N-acetyltransferase [Stellaceae bacterium]
MSAATDTGLAERIEGIHAETWPAIETWDYDGWQLRFARGYTRRANSISTAGPGTRPLETKIAACVAAYEARHIAPVFRLPSTAEIGEIDGVLEHQGYVKADKTSIRVASLDQPLPPRGDDVNIARQLTDEWLNHQMTWNGLDPDRRGAFAAIAGGIRRPSAFALLWSGAVAVAAGLAVRQGDLLCLHSIITAPTQRGRGFGRALTRGLLRWGQTHGATLAWLQVVKSNAPALRLYNALGFGREIYRYHYRARLGDAVNPAPGGTSAATPPARS